MLKRVEWVSLERFIEKKKNFEQGLAHDIMNQFMQEVAAGGDPLGLANGPNPAKGSPGKPSIPANVQQTTALQEVNAPRNRSKENGKQEEAGVTITPHNNLKGAWKQRVQESPPKSSKHGMNKDALVIKPTSSTPQKGGSNGNAQLITQKPSENPWHKKRELAEDQTPKMQSGKPESNIGEPVTQPGVNKWQAKKDQGIPKSVEQAPPKQPPSFAGPKAAIGQQALNKGIQKGGSAQQILKTAVKGMEAHDPELALKAQEFFFEKMGVALLNNFTKNLIPCPHCGRKFASDALKKHEGICARTNPLPKKKY